VNRDTGASGSLVLPISTEFPWRTTPTHAPLSHRREMRQSKSPETTGLIDIHILS
jgi:hypothetical protein